MTQPKPRQRDAGLTLIEVSVSITVFTVFALAVATTLTGGIEHRRTSLESYLAIRALEDLLSEIQFVANEPQDLASRVGVGAVYAKYHGTTKSVTELDGAQITVTIFPNEATVPSRLGGPQDLNFDGDRSDDLGNQSKGTDLKLIPCELSLSFGSGKSARSLVLSRLITVTTD